MKILVRNLSRNTKKEELRALFEPFGEIVSFDLIIDSETGVSKGFGFVEMPNSQQGQLAISKLNQQIVGGNRIRVKVAEESGEQARNDGS